MCAINGCNQPVVGKSKYCREHRVIARQKFKEMIAEKAAEREQRNDSFADLFQRAHLAGIDAGQRAIPTPMVVIERANPLDDASEIVRQYEPIADGVCGFAWITIYPGNCPAANYAKKHAGASAAYGGGVQIWVHEFGQSYERKMAFAGAYARVLRAGGVARAYSGGRLD